MESFTINREYAARYEKKKRTEELSKLRDKYGDVESDSSSSSEEEDEIAMEDNDQKTRNFFRTLSLLKKGDARIYDKEATFYDDESSRSGENRPVKKTKPVYLKDFERHQLLEKGEMAGVSDDEEDRVITHSEEQELLKTDFQEAVRQAEDDNDVLTLRHKSASELEQEESEYLKWLKNQPADLSPTEASDMGTLQKFWTDPNLDKDEAFLRDYVLNKRWLDMTPSIPSYHEIVDDVSDDEDAIEEQDDFERQFNFRFEEPNKELISRYPRTVSGSVRRTDEQRKLKRKEREERKTEEKKRKQDELKRLKNLKRQEIQDKLDKLRELTGNTTVGFDDLDGDFDPDAHDTAMSRVYDHFEDAEEDDEKPVFSDSDEEVNWDEWMPDGEEPHCEDPEFNMDADYDPSATPSDLPVKKKRSNKRKSKFAEVVTSNKQRYNPEEKTFDKFVDEYYQFEYEDFIGDLPCRFKYRQVVPNDFGLTTEEILTCEDRELNKWASLKKAVQYRTKEEEEKDVKMYRKKGRNQEKKQRVLVSYYEQQKEEKEEPKLKKRKRDSQKQKKHKKARVGSQLEAKLDPSRLAAYGLTTKTKKKKKNKKKE